MQMSWKTTRAPMALKLFLKNSSTAAFFPHDSRLMESKCCWWQRIAMQLLRRKHYISPTFTIFTIGQYLIPHHAMGDVVQTVEMARHNLIVIMHWDCVESLKLCYGQVYMGREVRFCRLAELLLWCKIPYNILQPRSICIIQWEKMGACTGYGVVVDVGVDFWCI